MSKHLSSIYFFTKNYSKSYWEVLILLHCQLIPSDFYYKIVFIGEHTYTKEVIIFLFIMSSSYKQTMLSYIAWYYHTHPHDDHAARFFQLINEITDESVLEILWQRMKKTLRTLSLHRSEHTKKTLRKITVATQESDTKDADEFLRMQWI